MASDSKIKALEEQVKALTEQLVKAKGSETPEQSKQDEEELNIKEREARSKIIIMISLQVSSMKASALLLKTVLEEQGYKVWVCVDMAGGVDFRQQIVAAVNQCTVFIPLINDAWAGSGECADEFSLAKRNHLTSHESGRTQRNEPRLPIFIPIAFQDLDWNRYPHIQLLAASTNFIVHSGGQDLTEGGARNTLDAVLLAMHGFGLSVDLPKSAQSKLDRQIISNSDQKTSGPQQQMMAITESLRAFATNIQSLAQADFQETRERRHKELDHKLGQEYLGVSDGHLVSTRENSKGYVMKWWNSFRLVVDRYDSATEAVEATITITNLRKEVITPDSVVQTMEELTEDHPLFGWRCLFIRESTFKGEFREDGLLTGTGNRVREFQDGVEHFDWVKKTYKYHLINQIDELVGVQLGEQSVSTLRLDLIM